MKALIRTAWIIGIMIVLSVLKFILNRTSPATFIFHATLITALQWLLLWLIIFWLLLHFAWRIFRKKDFPFGIALLLFLGLLALGEWGVYRMMQHADSVSGSMHRYLVKYYVIYERNLPEANSKCARYDPELTYTYKPGAVCVQDAPEFHDSMFVNKLGLRDDDASLHSPQVICLGDSYTVGFGVNQQETYPQVLERTTGMKVLNAGISSYGTARETILLKRLDTSSLQYLVIQYCYNDIAENKSYVERNYNLNVRSAPGYQKMVNDQKLNNFYFPWKRVLVFSRMIAMDVWSNGFAATFGKKIVPHDTSYVPAAARRFVDIVYHSGINFKKVKVVVTDVNRYPVYDHYLMQEVQRIIQQGAYSEDFKKSIHFVDVSELNNKKYFYPLDNHLNKEGHALMAELIRRGL